MLQFPSQLRSSSELANLIFISYDNLVNRETPLFSFFFHKDLYIYLRDTNHNLPINTYHEKFKIEKSQILPWMFFGVILWKVSAVAEPLRFFFSHLFFSCIFDMIVELLWLILGHHRLFFFSSRAALPFLHSFLLEIL